MDRVDNRTGVFRTVDGERREIAVEVIDDEFAALLRSRTPEERLRAAAAHARYLRRALRSPLESLHPEWSPEQLQSELTRRYLGQ